MHTKVAIVGSGPAGLTAAIYNGRALLNPIIIAGREFGGQLMTTTDVENFPGFPEGIQGPDLMMKMRQQAERFQTTFIDENVVTINIQSQPFAIATESQTLTTDAVILATGAGPKWLGLANESRLRGHGVSSCATCDGFFFRGRDIAVIGGGDSAMEEALYLTKFANRVVVIHRRDQLRASKFMQERAKADPKIEFIFNSEVKDILGDDTVTGVKLINNQTQQESELPVTGVFVAIGHVPNSAFLQGQIETDQLGYVIVKENYTTSIPGIFVAGDLHDHRYRQAVTAAGMGCAAALEAERYLTHKAQEQPQVTTVTSAQ